jgi:hypothetical protein
MGTVAEVRFRYEHNPTYEEVVTDLDVLDSKLRPKALIQRNGRTWQVTKVEIQRPADDPAQPPVWLIYLQSHQSQRTAARL